jgi:hypothetical protein
MGRICRRECVKTSEQLEKGHTSNQGFQTQAIVTYHYSKNRENKARKRYKATTPVKDYLTTKMAPPRTI